jgi:bifunctional non-homologous end joining protein LigD
MMHGSPMALEDYRRKRKFTETPEPLGRMRRSSRTRLFVVQKHRASRLHYDFRLVIDGVLVSWAVPKGPSMNPADRHLAIRTEDHPLEYVDFEGVIPENQYGAGTVMVWDRGPYELQGGIAPREQLVRGKIDVELKGTKLRGGFTLVRTGKRLTKTRDKELWLLIKWRDQYADPMWHIEDHRFDRSVITGRTLSEIASADAKATRSRGHANV